MWEQRAVSSSIYGIFWPRSFLNEFIIHPHSVSDPLLFLVKPSLALTKACTAIQQLKPDALLGSTTNDLHLSAFIMLYKTIDVYTL